MAKFSVEEKLEAVNQWKWELSFYRKVDGYG